MQTLLKTTLLATAVLMATALHAADSDETFGFDVKKVKTRYGKLTEAKHPDPDADGAVVLKYQDKIILDPFKAPGYDANKYQEDFFADHFAYGKTYHVGDTDVIPVYGFNKGANGQEVLPHFLIAIKPDKTVKVYGNDLMMSFKGNYYVKDKKFTAEYVQATVIYDGNTFHNTPKSMKEIPEDVCRNLYDSRAELREVTKQHGKGEFRFEVSRMTNGWVEEAERYKAYDAKKLAKAVRQKKISYKDFQKQVCR